MNSPHAVIELTDVRRSFVQGEVRIDVLRGVNLSVRRGEIVALLGPSGSGKSTLLQAVGLLEGGFTGSIRVNGEEAADLSSDGRTRSSLSWPVSFSASCHNFSFLWPGRPFTWPSLRSRISTSSANRVRPRRASAAARVDLPAPDTPVKACTLPSCTTAEACSGTSPFIHAIAPVTDPAMNRSTSLSVTLSARSTATPSPLR